jgi:dUTP pyrophosphatase
MSSSLTLYFKLLKPEAFALSRGTPESVGFDLKSPSLETIPARGKKLIDLGLQVFLPSKTYGRVAPRSVLALNHFIGIGGGVIDPDYQGELKVLLFNFSDQDLTVERGYPIAQLICEKYVHAHIKEVVCFDGAITQRGMNGFGSTDPPPPGEDVTGARNL